MNAAPQLFEARVVLVGIGILEVSTCDGGDRTVMISLLANLNALLNVYGPLTLEQ